MSATLATRPPKRFHPAGFHAFPFLPRFAGCFYARFRNGSAQSCATLGAVGRFEAFLSARFDSAISLHNAGQLYPQPPDAWGPSPHRQHLLSGFFFSMSHAFFHNSRAGILSAPFLARRMCVNKAPRPQTRGFFNAIWPSECSMVHVSGGIFPGGSSPRTAFYTPVAQVVEQRPPKPHVAGSSPAGSACVDWVDGKRDSGASGRESSGCSGPPTWSRLFYAAIAQLAERRPFKAGQRW